MNQHFNWYSRYTDLKRVEFNKLEVQQKFTCSKLYWSFDNKNGTIIIRTRCFSQRLIKTLFALNQDTVGYFTGTGSDKTFNNATIGMG